MSIKITKMRAIAVFLLLALIYAVPAALADRPDWFRDLEHTSDTIAKTQINNTPYPVNQMQHSLERQNLVERLLRFNNPNKIGYVYVMSFGKFVGYYAVKGKITSTQSQLTNTQQEWNGDTVVDSIGDDGSFGTNEGGDRGVFFFTTTGVLVEMSLDWVYSDAPLQVDVPNLLAKKSK